MKKIKFVNLNEAVIKTTNSVDEERVYDIQANVRIKNSTEVNNYDSGEVKRGETIVCTFSKYSEGQLNTNFQNVSDVMEMCTILQAINSFIIEVNAEVASGTSIVLN